MKFCKDALSLKTLLLPLFFFVLKSSDLNVILFMVFFMLPLLKERLISFFTPINHHLGVIMMGLGNSTDFQI
jgi:hypothetical protein